MEVVKAEIFEIISKKLTVLLTVFRLVLTVVIFVLTAFTRLLTVFRLVLTVVTFVLTAFTRLLTVFRLVLTVVTFVLTAFTRLLIARTAAVVGSPDKLDPSPTNLPNTVPAEMVEKNP